MKPLLIIVGGPSGAGKTTISRRVAEEFNLPLISKDRMKEILFDVLGCDEKTISRRYGAACMELVYSLAEDHLNVGVSIVIEANFLPEFATARVSKMLQGRDVDVIQVHCTADEDVIVDRVLGRITDGSRHPGHIDDRLTRQDVLDSIPPFSPMEGIGTLVTVDTTHNDVDLAALLGPLVRKRDDSASA